MASAGRSTSLSVVAQSDIDTRSTCWPRQVVPPTQQVPSGWMAATGGPGWRHLRRSRTGTWLRTTSSEETESGGHGARRSRSTMPFVAIVVDLAAPTPVLAAGPTHPNRVRLTIVTGLPRTRRGNRPAVKVQPVAAAAPVADTTAEAAECSRCRRPAGRPGAAPRASAALPGPRCPGRPSARPANRGSTCSP
jgi:hypothetical protein